MIEKNRIKTKVGVGSIVQENVRDMEEKTREGIIRRRMKEVVSLFQAVVGKKRLLFQLEYGQKKETSYC